MHGIARYHGSAHSRRTGAMPISSCSNTPTAAGSTARGAADLISSTWARPGAARLDRLRRGLGARRIRCAPPARWPRSRSGSTPAVGGGAVAHSPETRRGRASSRQHFASRRRATRCGRSRTSRPTWRARAHGPARRGDGLRQDWVACARAQGGGRRPPGRGAGADDGAPRSSTSIPFSERFRPVSRAWSCSRAFGAPRSRKR